MSRHISSTLFRLALSAACLLSSVSCGGDLLRTGRSPVYLVVDFVQGVNTKGTAASFLQSDVREDSGTVLNDNAVVQLHTELKNPALPTTPMQAVTLTRYHVDFRRADGRNTPGVDVPYSFDGGLSVTIQPSGAATATFEVVRHQAKLEPPLKNMDGLTPTGERLVSGLGFLSTVAEITIYGHDANGNQLSVKAYLDVHFGDFSF